jgi:hypothetical protein
MDGLQLLRRNEDNLGNEIKIVEEITKDINMNFRLEKYVRICLKKGSFHSKIYRKHI